MWINNEIPFGAEYTSSFHGPVNGFHLCNIVQL